MVFCMYKILDWFNGHQLDNMETMRIVAVCARARRWYYKTEFLVSLNWYSHSAAGSCIGNVWQKCVCARDLFMFTSIRSTICPFFKLNIAVHQLAGWLAS